MVVYYGQLFANCRRQSELSRLVRRTRKMVWLILMAALPSGFPCSIVIVVMHPYRYLKARSRFLRPGTGRLEVLRTRLGYVEKEPLYQLCAT
jgi:hypothetical protein